THVDMGFGPFSSYLDELAPHLNPAAAILRMNYQQYPDLRRCVLPRLRWLPNRGSRLREPEPSSPSCVQQKTTGSGRGLRRRSADPAVRWPAGTPLSP